MPLAEGSLATESRLLGALCGEKGVDNASHVSLMLGMVDHEVRNRNAGAKKMAEIMLFYTRHTSNALT
jgi:hypothetical protein